MAKKKSKKKDAKETGDRLREVELDPEVDIEEQVPLNELPTHFSNSYEVVVAAARRARQLNLGLRPLVKTEMYRPVDVALAELVAGKVEYTASDLEIERESKSKKKSRSKKS
ncbi:MAG: DNA-directed RNA polymerase subunit omega [bacterium]|jgi:DNA-directed RNA polymerase omega subunit